MKSNAFPLGLLMSAALTMSAAAASAASIDSRALNESELSDVFGRGLAPPTLAAFGALSTAEQSASYASASADDALRARGEFDADSSRNLDRQMAQQVLMTSTTGLQSVLKLSQAMSAVAPLPGTASPFAPPLLFAPVVPVAPLAPPAGGNKH